MRKEKWEQITQRIQKRLQKYGEIDIPVSTVKACAGVLTERQRDIVLMYYRDGDSSTEIAETFAISGKRVREVLRDFDIKVYLRASTDKLDDLYILADKGLPMKVIYTLRRGGLRTVASVAVWFKQPEESRKHIRGVGKASLVEIGAALLALKEED